MLEVTGDGGGDATPPRTAATVGGQRARHRRRPSVRILNWQAYIDPTEDGATGTLDRFKRGHRDRRSTTARTSTTTTRSTAKEFDAVPRHRQRRSPWDIVCPTNWMAARLKAWAGSSRCRSTSSPTTSTSRTAFLNLAWDPGPTYNLPWQAGITGIAYNPALTGRELTQHQRTCSTRSSRARSAMLTEMRDTRRAGDARPRATTRRRRRGRRDGRRSTRSSEANARRPDPARSPATTTCAASRTATSPPASPGPGDIAQLQYDRPTSSSCIPEEGGDELVRHDGHPQGRAERRTPRPSG